jgi:ABC-2 type transport system permease protein/oleandomycin transport system permease protein
MRRAIQDTASVLWRDVIRTTRQPEMLAFAVVMGVFFLVLFNYVFGGSIGAGAGVDYLEFLVPGVFVITALQGAQQTSLGLAADLAEGVTDRFRSLPMSQLAVITGRTIADAMRNVAGLILVALLALLMGYRFSTLGGALAAIALATAVGYGFSWLGATIAAKIRQPDMVGMLSMFWLFPLMLASTAFSPAETMPGWLQPFVKYQPISAASDAVRALANGTPAGGDIVLTMGWVAILLVVFGPLSMRLYRKVD